MSETYNGYKNYETWAAGMWVDGNYDGGYETYQSWQEIKAEAWDEAEADELLDRETRAKLNLADMLRACVAVWAGDQEGVTGLLADLLNGAIRSIDWDEVADCVIGDGWPEDDEEDS